MMCLVVWVVGCNGKEETHKSENTVPAVQKPKQEPEHMYKFYTEAKDYSERLNVTVYLENTGEETITLVFPSSQQFDVAISLPGEGELYRYSKGKMFTQVLTTVKLQPGEKKSWKASWKYNGTPYQVGKSYKIVSKLLPIEMNDKKVLENLFQDTTLFSGKKEEAASSVQIEGENGMYTIAGDAMGDIRRAVYTVEDGHTILIDKTQLSVQKPWKVQINIPKEKLPKNGVLLFILNMENQNGKTMQKEYVLEKFH
jgi:hypothetical protein